MGTRLVTPPLVTKITFATRLKTWHVPVHEATLKLAVCPCVSPVTESAAVRALEAAKDRRKKSFWQRALCCCSKS